jgi:hypothetical protein
MPAREESKQMELEKLRAQSPIAAAWTSLASNSMRAAALLSVLAVGCADTGEQESPDELAEAAPELQAYTYLPTGFYTTPETGGKVLFVKGTTYCWVLDPGQLDALAIVNFGGYKRGTTKTSLASIATDRAGSSNSYCDWPGGMVMQDNPQELENAVYFIDERNKTSCHLISDEQVYHHGGWGIVWDMPHAYWDAKFKTVTRYLGDCTY